MSPSHASAPRHPARTLLSGLLVVIGIVVLAARTPAAAATDAVVSDVGGTYLTWWACPGDPHAVSNVPFDCVAGGGIVYTLVGSFTVAIDVPRAKTMSIDVNVAFPGLQSVPPFWAIDGAGCNASGFTLVKGAPAGCVDHVNAFCRGDSNQCDLLYTASVVPGSGMLRLAITAARGFPDTTSLAAGQRYFAFALNVPMDAAASCGGCTAPAAIGFNQGTIYSVDSNGQPLPPIVVTGSYPGAKACATVNDGVSDCSRVPVQRRTWGRLKSLYR